MADLSEFEPVRFGERTYIPLLVLDGQMRRCEFRVPDASKPPRYSRAVQPYACQECADLTIDPDAHNVLHDGPSVAQTVDLVAALRQSIEDAKHARRGEAGERP